VKDRDDRWDFRLWTKSPDFGGTLSIIGRMPRSLPYLYVDVEAEQTSLHLPDRDRVPLLRALAASLGYEVRKRVRP
jgi:hypothetical protein